MLVKPIRELSRRDWIEIAKATGRRFSDVGVTDRAAALTYYGVLSLFPALLVGVAVLALLGTFPETYQSIMSTLREAAPDAALDTVDNALAGVLQSEDRTARSILGLGLVGALWAASGAMGAATRGLDDLRGIRDRRPFLKAVAIRIALTIAVMGMLLLAFLSVIVAGPLIGSIADTAGIADTATVLNLARWPVAAAAVLAAIVLLYVAGPSKGTRSVKLAIPGALLAGGLWLAASSAFSFYVSNFAAYNATYGALGAIIVLLVWLWISSIALFTGAALNIEIEHKVRRDHPSPLADPRIGDEERSPVSVS